MPTLWLVQHYMWYSAPSHPKGESDAPSGYLSPGIHNRADYGQPGARAAGDCWPYRLRDRQSLQGPRHQRRACGSDRKPTKSCKLRPSRSTDQAMTMSNPRRAASLQSPSNSGRLSRPPVPTYSCANRASTPRRLPARRCFTVVS